MTSTDDTFIHGWHFSIHGWHPRMVLSSMDEVSPSMDGIFIRQRPEAIWKEFSLGKMMDTIFYKNLTDENPIHGQRNFIHVWKCHPWISWRCHPWMEKCHPWMSSMDESVILGCHPRMALPSGDDGHGWSRGCMLYTLRRFEKDKIVWFIHPFLLFLTLTNDSFFSFQRILQILRNYKFLCANSFTFEHLELEIYHKSWFKIKSATLNPGTLSTIHWWSCYTIHLIFR